MKKLLTVLIGVLAFAAVASAQPRALGVRAGYGGEISYQHTTGPGFIEADLGFLAGHGFYVTGVYDFIFANSGICNFYVAVCSWARGITKRRTAATSSSLTLRSWVRSARRSSSMLSR